jgi:diguanylate cyclase (GGDEF)-like protein/PAS domain S-box-containing protein
VTRIHQGIYETLLDQVSDGVYFVDRECRILYWNEGAHRLTGYKADEVLGRYCMDDAFCHMDTTGHRMRPDDCPLNATLNDGKSREVEVFLRHKQGRRVPVTARVQPIRAADGSIAGAVQIFSDDSAEQDARRRIEEMERLAFLDHVTQLPNRRFVEMSLQTALNEFQIHRNPFGLLVIDLDQFKSINDRFGHACGDRALLEVAKTLAGALRPTDVVGRWGGDEFIAIARHIDQKNLRKVGERCRALVAGTTYANCDDCRASVSVSIGATLALPGDTAEAMVQRADALMYRNKPIAGVPNDAKPRKSLLSVWRKKLFGQNPWSCRCRLWLNSLR